MTPKPNAVAESAANPLGQESERNSGLAALCVLLNLLQLPAEPRRLSRELAIDDKPTPTDLVRGAELCGAQAQLYPVGRERLGKLPLPCLARFKDGGYRVIAAYKDGRFLIRDPEQATHQSLTIAELGEQWTDLTILIKRRTARIGESGFRFGRFGARWFLPELARYRGAVGNLLAASLLLQIFALVTPLFTMIVIDKVLSTSGYSTLDVLVLGLLAIAGFDFAVGSLRSHLLGHLSNRIDVKLAATLFAHLLRLPLGFFTHRRTGDTVTRIRELEVIRNFFTGPTLMAVIDFPFTLVFLLVMYWFSPSLTWLVIGAMCALLLLYGLAGKLLRERIRRKNLSNADNQSFLVESILAIETCKALAAEPQLQRQWEEQVVSNSQSAKDMEQLNHQLMQAASFINKVIIALALWIGAKAVLGGEMTAGQLIGFNMMIGRVLAPALRIAQLFQHLQQAEVAMQRVGELLTAQPEQTEAYVAEGSPRIRGEVRFERVSFAYQADAQPVLEDINFEVEAGEVIGIVGLSGAGKTTLIRLLQRLYLPQKGRIFIDGVNIAQANPAWLRSQIGTVAQDTLLLNRSIRENIAITQPGAGMAEIEAAARLAGAESFIRALPAAYNTQVGERGMALSMGQRQRIALARALLGDPRILILDEATSALDYQAERQIQENMRDIVKGRTVFIVAHRLSSLAIADRILLLENGRILETGTIDSLLTAKGRFAELYETQADLFKRHQIALA